jgi:hypothetical protein
MCSFFLNVKLTNNNKVIFLSESIFFGFRVVVSKVAIHTDEHFASTKKN